MVTTLHTPQLADMQAAITAAGPRAGKFVAVSATTGASWVTPHPITVVPNGVNTRLFSPVAAVPVRCGSGASFPKRVPT